MRAKIYKPNFSNKNDVKLSTVDDAIKLVKKNCNTKFNESIDLSFYLNLTVYTFRVFLRIKLD